MILYDIISYHITSYYYTIMLSYYYTRTNDSVPHGL